MLQNKLFLAVFFGFVLTGAASFLAPSAHAQLLFGGGNYLGDLSFKEEGKRYSSAGGNNLLVGYSLLPPLLIIPSLAFSLEADSFSGSEMAVDAQSLGAEIGFGIPFLSIYAKLAAGNAEIARKSGAGGHDKKQGRFVKERYGVEVGVYLANLFFEQGNISFGGYSSSPRLLGIKFRIPF